jgi:putative CocE/NonD family hydrolase
VSADLHVRSSLDHTDFYVRLCDVDGKGRSFNLADGIIRIGPEHPRTSEGCLDLHIEMFPTANTFAKGHRIRLQVSSGAHPLYVRNLGTGEPLGKGTTMLAADQEVFHDPIRPSAIVLPVLAEPVRA